MAAVEERYQLSPMTVRAPLEGGYANDVLQLEARAKPYVRRVKHPPVVPESIAWEHALVGRLAELLPTVAAPLPGSTSSTTCARSIASHSANRTFADRARPPNQRTE